jgi:ceramide glucosyltransferase
MATIDLGAPQNMPDSTTALLALVAIPLTLHLLSAALTAWRARRPKITPAPDRLAQSVALLRPVCGVDPNDEATLGSTFALDPHPSLEIVFCAARESDPAVPLLRRLIAENPHVHARLLIGDERPTPNPKLNNLVKGWRGTDSDWVIMADSNVLLPPDYLADLAGAFKPGTGLVCSPPVGSAPVGLAAEIECAFLNTYQGRWQVAADTLGFGFAQGKTMYWRRDLLDAAGGIEALGADAAEDAAATKIVRANGGRVRLVDRPYPQPLGRRHLRDMWDRQIRWARLRRATFPHFYAPEILAGPLVPMGALALVAGDVGLDPAAAVAGVAALWYGAEAALAKGAGWHLSRWSALAFVLRDLMLPAVWIGGLTGNGFTWRGNEMNAALSITTPQHPQG